MGLPIRFPPEGDRIYEESVAYRRLDSTERFLALADLMASGQSLLKQSAHRGAGSCLQQAQEAEWRRAQKELFARHGR